MRNFKQCLLVGGLGMAMAAGAVTGCSYMNSKEARQTGRTTGQVETDKMTTERVESELANAPVFKYPAVRVQTFDGTVQLSGFVQTQEQKRSATEIAQHVPGVQRVENNITISAPTAQGGANGQTYQGQGSGRAPAPIFYPTGQTQQQPNSGGNNNPPPANSGTQK
ncbi:MAG TPA: BON domain-containing protein [Verrucomicrobiae bacterium]|nr:BON domain-containing protein [Verrucomicrobiae bacterium]